jgi:hypothetical protein
MRGAIVGRITSLVISASNRQCEGSSAAAHSHHGEREYLFRCRRCSMPTYTSLKTFDRFHRISCGEHIAEICCTQREDAYWVSCVDGPVQIFELVVHSGTRMEPRVTKSTRELGIGGENSQPSIVRLCSDLFGFLKRRHPGFRPYPEPTIVDPEVLVGSAGGGH